MHKITASKILGGLVLGLLLFSSPLYAQDDLETPDLLEHTDIKGKNLIIEYTSPFVHILIADGQVMFTKIEEKYDHKGGNIPSHHSVDTKTADITEEEVVQLVEYIEELGFMDLKNNYGAPDSVRHYTYTIKVGREGSEKVVTYKSHPEHELEPDAFDQVEVFLREYIDGVENWK